MSEVQIFIDAMRAQPAWNYYLIAGLLALLVLLVAVRVMRQPARLHAFSTERGTVHIARRAISEMILKSAALTFGVVKCRSRIKVNKDKLCIALRISLRADSDLREVQKHLETQIVDSLKHNLGFGNLGPIDTTVTSIVGDPVESHPVALEAPDGIRVEDPSGKKPDAKMRVDFSSPAPKPPNSEDADDRI
ncbi:MAG: hypothetical protein WC360_00070 [Opitutales bacterium]|jgi:hypothetical protein